jgi:O-antigen/teichoic acid export membrane protein
VTTLTVPILISILTFAEELLSIFGPEFRQGASCLMILSVGFFVQAATGHTTALIVLSGRPRWLLINNTAAMVVNILLNYVLIQKYSIIGAALATAISISLSNLAQLTMVYRLFGFHPYTVSYWKIILAAAAGAFVFVGLKSAQVTSPLAFLVFICVGISIYFFLLWKIGLDEQEKMLVQAFQRKLKSLVGIRGQ